MNENTTPEKIVDESINELLNDEINIENATEIATEDTEDSIYFSNGIELTLQKTYDLTSSCDTRFIYLLGPVNCGKTTIETTLYQLFHYGTLGEYYFAGSNTLDAYEQRAFATRINSNASVPVTPRTPVTPEVMFLHLKLWKATQNKFINNLYADISGEIFESTIGNVDLIKVNFPYLKDADVIVNVLDISMVIDKSQRRGAIENLKHQIRTILEANLFNAKTQFQVVFSKYDLITNEAKNFLEEQKRMLESIFNGICLKFYEVAAMPVSEEKFNVGYGLKELLASWNAMQDYKPKNSSIEVSAPMNQLGKRLLGVSYE